jgi:ankyrin repeat protein
VRVLVIITMLLLFFIHFSSPAECVVVEMPQQSSLDESPMTTVNLEYPVGFSTLLAATSGAVDKESIETQSDADSIDSFFRAIATGDITLVRQMIDKAPSLANVKKKLYQFDIFIAGKDIIITPLHFAVMNRNKSMAELLISMGADINSKDEVNFTPLMKALAELNEYIREPDDITHINQEAYRSIASFLISKGADVKLNDNGATILIMVCSLKTKGIELLELLVARGVDVKARDCNGQTPLHRAATREIAELLITKGADVNAKDNNGNTPLHRAATREIAELLITKGADVNAKDNNGNTPLHSNHVYILESSREIAELLVSHGADINARNNKGRTPLHTSAHQNLTASQITKTEYLILNGADINAKDNMGNTPLHEAVGHWGSYRIVELLIIKGADINRKNYAGRTPLYYAQKDGPENSQEIIELLKNLGAKE